jgi:2,3-dimethylmalate lyase
MAQEMRDPGAAFRRLLDREGTTLIAGAHDMVTARIVEEAGFEAIWLGGLANTASLLGMPDASFLSLPEQAAQCRAMSALIDIPIIVDAENGYGNVTNILRVVHEFESAGAGAMVIEDQASPKKCALYGGELPLITAEEHAAKVAAAVDRRRNPNFVIVARTDAILTIYRDLDDIAEFARQWDHSRAPQLITQTMVPDKSVDELAELGLKIVIQPHFGLQVAIHGIREGMAYLRREGKIAGFEGAVPFDGINEIVRHREIAEYEARFANA